MTVILYYRYTPNRYTTTVQYYAQQQVGDYKSVLRCHELDVCV